MRSFFSSALGGFGCVAVALSTTGCSLLPGMPSAPEIKPVAPPASALSLLSDEGVYQDAVRDITNRDYARALDYLQVARSRSPKDVRVFNALGVVYDKLGRFDLSARYYAEAKALSPDSRIVENNIAYSARLQRGMNLTTPLPSVAVAEAKTPTPAPVSAQDKPHDTNAVSSPALVSQIAAEQPATDPVPASARAWSGVAIVDGTQGVVAARRVRRTLVRRGWAVWKANAKALSPQAFTTVQYAPSSMYAAKSLVHTLTFPVQLKVCNDNCRGVVLVLGADALNRMGTHRAVLAEVSTAPTASEER